MTFMPALTVKIVTMRLTALSGYVGGLRATVSHNFYKQLIQQWKAAEESPSTNMVTYIFSYI